VFKKLPKKSKKPLLLKKSFFTKKQTLQKNENTASCN
jgi:hypothetical protein